MFLLFELELYIPETEKGFRLGKTRGAMAASPEPRIGGLLVQSFAEFWLKVCVLTSRCEVSTWEASNAHDLHVLCATVSMIIYQRFQWHRTMFCNNLDCDAKA